MCDDYILLQSFFITILIVFKSHTEYINGNIALVILVRPWYIDNSFP